eukprot:scaffold86507_cov24-Tisochrysis_lutea.AAC.3
MPAREGRALLAGAEPSEAHSTVSPGSLLVPACAQVLCADLRAVLTHCHFAGNPARFTLGSQQVCGARRTNCFAP